MGKIGTTIGVWVTPERYKQIQEKFPRTKDSDILREALEYVMGEKLNLSLNADVENKLRKKYPGKTLKEIIGILIVKELK